MITDKAIITTGSEGETFKVGETLGKLIVSPLVITLNGELGAGKTVLVRGAAAGLGINEPVRSPTFNLMMIYSSGRMPVYHFDFYRLAEEDELEALDLEEYLEGRGAAFIEWAGKFPDSLPDERLDIEITYAFYGSGEVTGEEEENQNERILTFHPRGRIYSDITDKMFEIIKHNITGELKQ